MNRNSVISAAVALAVLTAGATACSSDESSTTTTAREATTTEARAGFEVSTPDGQVSLSLDGQLPSGWPSGFPLPDKTEPAGSGSLVGSTSGQLVAVYTTTQSGKDAFDFYTEQTALQPSDQKSIGSTNFFGTMKITGPNPGSIAVTEVSGTTYIVVVLTTSGASTSTTASTSATASTTSAGG